MDISKLIDMHKDKERVVFTGSCHDCGCDVRVSSEQSPDKTISISGGAVYETSNGLFFKCDPCLKKGELLNNYQPCEVYSRIVGYLRPVGQWNKGKQSEFEKRKMLAV